MCSNKTYLFQKLINFFQHCPTPNSLTPRVCVDVLLTGDKQASMEGGEDEAVITRIPGLDVRRVGQAGNGDTVALFDG